MTKEAIFDGLFKCVLKRARRTVLPDGQTVISWRNVNRLFHTPVAGTLRMCYAKLCEEIAKRIWNQRLHE